MKTIGLTFPIKLDVDTPLPFPCPHCKNEYKEQRYLDEHIKKKHPDKLE